VLRAAYIAEMYAFARDPDARHVSKDGQDSESEMILRGEPVPEAEIKGAMETLRKRDAEILKHMDDISVEEMFAQIFLDPEQAN
jgi:hypothetical protein